MKETKEEQHLGVNLGCYKLLLFYLLSIYFSDFDNIDITNDEKQDEEDVIFVVTNQ